MNESLSNRLHRHWSNFTAKLAVFWHAVYETRKGYRLNPCDAGALTELKGLGQALAWLSVECPCCSGFRILAATVSGMVLPWFVTTAVIILWVVAAIWLTLYPRATDENI